MISLLEWADSAPYGVGDLAPDVASGYSNGTLVRETEIKCCVRDCPHWVRRRRVGQSKAEGLYCPLHEISISTTPTYIFKDHQRNFIVGRSLLGQVKKVESWRLGHETSEDAVSWNVFVGLLLAGGLSDCFELLTGSAALTEPELYLWGNRIQRTEAPAVCRQLGEVRQELESGTGIPTEPDVILRVPGQALVLVEAKFGSPNGRFVGKEERFGSVSDYLSRYSTKQGQLDPLNREWISAQPSEQILEQLCRNAIFATWLSTDGESPHVVNLVSASSEPSIEEEFGRHLRPGVLTFHRRTWDDIARLPIMAEDAAVPLRAYLDNKTLRLRKALTTV